MECVSKDTSDTGTGNVSFFKAFKNLTVYMFSEDLIFLMSVFLKESVVDIQ